MPVGDRATGLEKVRGEEFVDEREFNDPVRHTEPLAVVSSERDFLVVVL